jgi:hypothetical protein
VCVYLHSVEWCGVGEGEAVSDWKDGGGAELFGMRV